MRIMLIGANGQVGWELARSLMPLGEVVALTRAQCDLSRPETIPGIVQAIKPDWIVNAAAYTAVDKAEEEEVLATTINGTAVGVLAEQAKRRNALLVHYSTDYVFDGTKSTPYTEEDESNPINAYGRSKLAGEQAVREVGGEHLIFRTSWVYSARGSNFVRAMLKLAKEQDRFEVVSDQIGAPTSVALIADVTALALHHLATNPLQRGRLSGIYHLTASEFTSWQQFAQLAIGMAKELGLSLKAKPDSVLPILSSEYSSLAKRPLNSRLNTEKTSNTFNVRLPRWQKYMDRVLMEMLGAKSEW